MPTSSIRRSILTSLASLAIAAAIAAPAQAQVKQKVFAYYPTFDLTPNLTNDQLKLVTHVIFFSVKMPSDGRLTDTYVASATNGQKLIDLADRGRTYNVKVMLGIGGWELSNEFAGVAADANRRRTFATTAAKFCTDNGIAGIDIDWEFPTGHQANLALLLDETSKTFKAANLLLTMSVNGQAPQYYGSAALNKVDYVHIMSYDNGTPHSTYDQAVQAVGAYAGQVTQKNKLCLGMPFYGKSGGATKTYAEIYQSNPSPSANDAGGYNFNGPNLIQQKSEYIVTQGGGGTMIWQISQDALPSSAPGGVLLTAMNKGFTNKGTSLDKPTVSLADRGGAAAPGLRRELAGYTLSTAGLPRGAYVLSVFTSSGERAYAAEAQHEGLPLLRWPGVRESGARYYRVEGGPRLIASGSLP